MGLFRTSDSIISQAMPLTATMLASIDQRPAWLFQNQSGTLGTNLNSSVIYCGAMATNSTISVIVAGTVSQTVSTLTLTSGGTGYSTANNVATTVSPTIGSGLTVNIIASSATFSGPVGGNGNYSTGTIDTFVPAGAAGTINSVDGSGNPLTVTLTGLNGYTIGAEVELKQTASSTTAEVSLSSPAITTTIQRNPAFGIPPVTNGMIVTGPVGNTYIASGTLVTNAGNGLTDDIVINQSSIGSGIPGGSILTFTDGANATGSKITITATGGVVSSATVGNSGGLTYQVGDVITVAQGGSGLNATLTVTDILFPPLTSQAILFGGLQPGSILPVVVDYVTAVTGDVPLSGNFIVGR